MHQLLVAVALTFAAMTAAAGQAAAEPVPAVSAGRVQRLDHFASRYVEARNIDVWLPEGYAAGKRYAVIYMQDGQALFDGSLMPNGQSWQAAETFARLMQAGKISDALVVGVWNTGKLRRAEYYPQKFLAATAEPVRSRFVAKYLEGRSRSDDYLRFLTRELKPYIDVHFSTRPDREHTFVMGSSMGGLISLYAICEYPQIFGGAAAMSTHWSGDFVANAALPLGAFIYLRDHLPDPGTHRLYMDHGTAGLDALYGPYQTFIDQIVRERGYTDADFMTRIFDGATHSEPDWARRLEIPVTFLLGR